ncbi:MAG: ABC transporter ATP-binding protein [Caldilineaceae bacterium]|nr:ABC transporter ATP-binding protein [Caldilineaceae bacterium]
MTEQSAQRRTTNQTGAAPEMPPIMGRGGPMGMRHLGKVEHAKDRQGTVLRIWHYLRRQRTAVMVTTILVILNTLLALVGPYLLTKAIDEAIIPGDLNKLASISAIMLAAYGLNSLFTWLQAYVMAGAAQRTVSELRNDLFDNLQRLSLRFFDQNAHGDLMSRLSNDVENVNTVLAESATQLVSGILSLVGVAIMMLWLNPRLALVTLIVLPLMMLLLTRWVAPRTRSGFRAQQSTLGQLNGLIEETITGQRVVKAYSREAQVMADFDRANLALRQAATRAQIFAGFMGPLINFVNNMGLAIVAGVGGWMAVQGLATVGAIAGFINYSRQFSRPLNEIANLYNSIQSAIAGAERVFAIIDEEPDLVDAPVTQALPQIQGDVRFDNVSFGYISTEPVLQNVSLHAKPGQIIALVGPTGAGKTTIVNLLTRFYDVTAGRITIDGVDLRLLSQDELRRQLGIVLQDTFLFAGTVMDNIRYGRAPGSPAATDEEVIAAAKLANADQFIHRLPLGYATVLSERGSNLSQGQRQLLSIARAILANPRILILDEATSSVDTRTEYHLQEAMRRLMTGRTSFVIAHRLSTIRDADQILVINHGEIIEQGTHQSLLGQQGFYYNLYHSQFRAQSRRTPVNGTPHHGQATLPVGHGKLAQTG